MSQYQKGLEGERLAEAYLINRGYKVLARRYRTSHLEVDLVAGKGNTLFFFEVKHRPMGRLGDGIMFITPQKRSHLQDAMKTFHATGYHSRQLAYLEITRAGILLREDVLHEN